MNQDKQRTLPRLALVIPCFNEDEIIEQSVQTIMHKLAEWKNAKLIADESYACFIDNGCTDNTWALLTEPAQDFVHCIKLTHNVGHQNGLAAGMAYVSKTADCCVTLDADLQDDLDVIPQMLAGYAAGADVVYGVRSDRSTDSWFKSGFAHLFYQFAGMLGVAGIKNHADYRLLSKRALLVIREFKERHLYYRGLIPSLGLPAAKVFYARRARIGGSTKYTPSMMLKLAFDGITSFSIVPLRAISLMGIVIATIAFCAGIFHIYGYMFHEGIIDGWTSLIVSLYFLGGLIIFSLGVAGEYIGKIFMESKKRPLYIIEDILEPGTSARQESSNTD